MKISVITPSFNQGHFIDRTIQSVFSQNLESEAGSLEYFVCDGGSQDQTIEILRNYADRFSQFWYDSEPDRGQAHAINKGITQTDGEIIAWLNSDDFYYPKTLQTVFQIFHQNPQVFALYGQANQVDENDRFLEAYPVEPWNYKRLSQTCYLCQPAVFFRRSLVQHFGNLNESFQYSMDYELWLRYGKETEFLYIPQVLAASRVYPTTKTLSNRPAVFYESSLAVKLHTGSVPDRWVLGHAFVVAEANLGNRNAPLSTQTGFGTTTTTFQSIRSSPYDKIFFREFLRASLQNYKYWQQFPSLWGLGKLLRWFIQCYLNILF